MKKPSIPPLRETSVLRLLACGYTNKEIAGCLRLSVKTVEAHTSSAMRRLKLNDRVGVLQYAVEQGWLERDVMPDALVQAISSVVPQVG